MDQIVVPSGLLVCLADSALREGYMPEASSDWSSGTLGNKYMTTFLQKRCFVLMPFTSALTEIYTDIYVPVCNANGLKPWRVDEIARPGSITKDIIEGILDADVIIADLTSRNPNVFYELGIAHATGNKTIMTSQTDTDVPFDIANYRVIFYEHTLTGSKELTGKLDLAIKELLAALDRTNNPFQEVTAGRGGFRVKGKTPLFKAVNTTYFTKPVRELLKARKIIYVEELKTLDLEELLRTPGFGATSLAQICSLFSEYELYDTVEAFNSFIVENRIDLKSNSIPGSMYTRRIGFSL